MKSFFQSFFTVLVLGWILGPYTGPLKASPNAHAERKAAVCMVNNSLLGLEAMSFASDVASLDIGAVAGRGLNGSLRLPLPTDCFEGLSDQEVADVRAGTEYQMVREKIEVDHARLARIVSGAGWY